LFSFVCLTDPGDSPVAARSGYRIICRNKEVIKAKIDDLQAEVNEKDEQFERQAEMIE